ncbi:hypothetical protein B003_03050 [Vibrio breoganii 1C10]|nr:hypothetical protein B003_03050 [Vibrio breoganii 1C10]
MLSNYKRFLKLLRKEVQNESTPNVRLQSKLKSLVNRYEKSFVVTNTNEHNLEKYHNRLIEQINKKVEYRKHRQDLYHAINLVENTFKYSTTK